MNFTAFSRWRSIRAGLTLMKEEAGAPKRLSPRSIAIVVCFAFSVLASFPAFSDVFESWRAGEFRGFTSDHDLTREDIIAMKRLGANVVRVGFHRMPFRRMSRPYTFDEEAFSTLRSLLQMCREEQLAVVLDPHTFPGMQRRTSGSAGDLFWRRKYYESLLIETWTRLVQEVLPWRDIIAGYDLVNEPFAPFGFPEPSEKGWSYLAGAISEEIRRQDPFTPIVIGVPAGRDATGKLFNRTTGIAFLRLPDNVKRIVVSPHVYFPLAFTHQGLGKYESRVHSYPGTIDGEYWDKARVYEEFAPLELFAKSNDAPIYIGEFSAVRWAGDSATRYLGDLIALFNKRHWNWTYHSFRESPAWNAEIRSLRRESLGPLGETPTLRILKRGFSHQPKMLSPTVHVGHDGR